MSVEPMIERVARALFIAGMRTSVLPGFDAREAFYGDWSAVEDEVKNGYRANARAVIAAMRGLPPETRRMACESEHVVAWGDYGEFWDAAIDTMLAAD